MNAYRTSACMANVLCMIEFEALFNNCRVAASHSVGKLPRLQKTFDNALEHIEVCVADHFVSFNFKSNLYRLSFGARKIRRI
jgi:hypothetical protein